MVTTVIDRFLEQLDGDEPGTRAVKLRAYETILVLVLVTEYWGDSILGWAALNFLDLAALAAVTVLVAGVLHGRWRRAAFAGLAILQLWYVQDRFPLAGNHRYLELVLCGFFAFLDDEDPVERRLLLRSLRWIVIVVLFYSGLQKLVHGYYFRGQFLTFSLWRDWFYTALSPLLPPDELARLTSYGGEVGEGPYQSSSPLFVGLSNGIWMAEMLLAALLLPRRTRRFAWVAACVFMVATQLVAREFIFGVEFICALALFSTSAVLRRWIVPIGVFLVLLLMIRAGIVPQVVFL